MKSTSIRRLQTGLIVLLTAVLFTACTTEEPTLIPLPTARVPSLLEIDRATGQWESGNNQNYFVSVEETTNEGTFLYRIVIADGEIRVAQRLEKVEGKWQQPQPISNEIAEKYTVDALLARVLQDAKGEGAAPLNMFTVFDPFSGYPTLVEAKAIPSYTEDGKMRLNREHSYLFSLTVDILLEDTFGANKTPLLTLHLSGGETAACSTLRIFDDRTSVYSDDCRQILLQINPPENSLSELQAHADELALIDEVRSEGNSTNRLILNGTGTHVANAEVLDEIWALAFDLNQMLSQPIGAGVTLLAWNGTGISGFDMRTNLEQPASLAFRAPFYGGITNDTGKLLVYADGAGLKWLNTVSGEAGTYSSNPAGQHYVPLDVTSGGKILLQRYTDGSDMAEWGWISLDDRSWHPLIQENACVAGVQANLLDERVVVIVPGSQGCESSSSLWIVDLDSGTVEAVDTGESRAAAVSWSPDAATIAAALETEGADGTVTVGLYTIEAAGMGITHLTDVAGRITGLTWRDDSERIFFGLTDAAEADNGLIEYDPAAGEITNFLNGTGLTPIGFDPTGEFLAFLEGKDLRVWLVAFGRVVPITQNAPVENPFIGWTDSTSGD